MSIFHTLFNKSKVRTLKRIGLRYEFTPNNYTFRENAPSDVQENNCEGILNHPDSTVSECQINAGIVKGWYMLEVQGNVDTLGANFCLSGINSHSSLSKENKTNTVLSESVDVLPRYRFMRSRNEVKKSLNNIYFWNVLIGSHKLSKRIIYCPVDIVSFQIGIDGNVPVKKMPAFSLTRLSKKFTLDRIGKKIKYASQYDIGNEIERRSNSDSINYTKDYKTDFLINRYRIYNQLVERHVNPITYEKWLSGKNKNALNYNVPPSMARCSASCIIKQQSRKGADGKFSNTNAVLIHILENKYTINQKRALLNSTQKLVIDHQLDVTMLCASHINEYVTKHIEKKYRDNIRCTNTDNLTKNAINDFIENSNCEKHTYIDNAVYLEVHALSEYFRILNSNSDANLVYSDHDSIDSFGRRKNPVFKPEWNRELLYNTNYVGGLVMLKKCVYKSNCSWMSELENAALYYVLLQLSLEFTLLSAIRIPAILYHKIGNADISEKPFNPKVSKKHISKNTEQTIGQLWINERDVQAVALVLESHAYRIGYLEKIKNQSSLDNLNVSLTDGKLRRTFQCDLEFGQILPSVDIIVPSRDKVSLLRTCLNSIINNTDYSNYRVLIIDNGSVESETLEFYDSIVSSNNIEIISSPGPFNYSKLNNMAVEASDSDILVLLNNDTEVINSEWLHELVKQAIRPEVGCVGAKLYYSNERIQHGGVIVGMKGLAGHAHRFSSRDDDGYCGRLKLSQYMSAVTAACLAVRRSLYLEVNGLDEVNLKVAYNDVDFCMRIQGLGYNNVWTPYAELFHHESVSRGSDDTGEKRSRFISEYDYMKKRWCTDTIEDPAYNPNLSKDLEDFSLAS